jgi:methyl-accepting chemotaxis protein
VNRPYLDLVGFRGTVDHATGQSVEQLLLTRDGEKSVLHRCVEEQRPLAGLERTWHDLDGEELRVRVDAAPLYDLDGRDIGGLALVTDLTDVYAKEERISA